MTFFSHSLIFAVPELPTGKCLKVQHFQSALDGGSEAASLPHEEGFLGVIDEVIKQVTRGKGCVCQRRSSIHIRKHSQGGAVDDDGVLGEDGGSEVGVGEDILGGQTAEH